MREKTTRPIEWHERCLENQKASLGWRLGELRKAQENVDRMVKSIRHYTSQIARAKRLGKTEFDRDKFKGEE